jgi:hypothetical protein
MGLLVVGALAGILISLAWFAPSQGYPGYISQPYFNQAVNSRPVEPGPKASPPHAALAKAPPKSAMASKRKKKRSPVKLAKRTPAPATPRAAASDHPAEVQDEVMDKAKTTIAAKLEEPATAEFSDMKRAMRKNMFGQPVDTICGHVSGRTASGEETAEKPFLYLVQDDDAYVVDGKTNSAASIAYRNICN